MITAEHLTKQYKKKKAVDDLSFTIETGKVTGFLGPNGAGKSTTMRLMLGLDHGSGKTTFDKKALNQYARPSQVVGILLEAKAFHPTRTAYQHLRILADAGGIDPKRVNAVLDEVGLSSVAKKGPGKFSLGMSQRLGIAAAILGQPKYLLLDEPANGLDPEGIAWLRTFLKDYADRGNAVFVSSHLLSEMALMADNVVVIGQGKLIADTSIAELTASSSHGVLVRVDDMSKMEAVLTKKQIEFAATEQGIRIPNKATDEIGALAFAQKLTVLELSTQQASLEQIFLEITSDSAEYRKGGK